jgi:tetratricopeptide (TPR) repeat protein
MKQVLTSEPGAVDARYYMADALRLQGQYPQALKAFNDIISSDPGFAPAYLGRARTRLGSGAGSLERPGQTWKPRLKTIRIWQRLTWNWFPY